MNNPIRSIHAVAVFDRQAEQRRGFTPQRVQIPLQTASQSVNVQLFQVELFLTRGLLMDISYVPAVSCLVFFVVLVLLLSIIYHKDPHCCKLRSCRGQRTDVVRP